MLSGKEDKFQGRVLFFTRDPRPEYKRIEETLLKGGCELRHVTTTAYAYKAFKAEGKKTDYLFNYFTPERQQKASAWFKKTKNVSLEVLDYKGYPLNNILQYEKAVLEKLRDVRPLTWWYPLEFNSVEDAFYKLRFYVALLIDVVEDILRKEMPDRVVMWNGFPAKRRVISIVAESLGIRRLYLERGYFRGTMQMDTEGVNVLSSLGKDTDPGTELSALQRQALNLFLKDFTFGEKSVVEQQGSFSAKQWRHDLGIGNSTRVIFLPLQVYHDTNLMLFSRFSSNEELLSALMEGVRRVGDVFMVAKSHPESDAAEVRKLQEIMGDRGRVIEKGNIHSLIRLSDIVAVNNSTVGLEALAYFKPLLAFGESVYSNKNIAFKVNAPEEIQSLLRNALSLNGKLSGQMRVMAEAFIYRVVFEYLSPALDIKEQESEERIFRKFFPEVGTGKSLKKHSERTSPIKVQKKSTQHLKGNNYKSVSHSVDRGLMLKNRIREANNLVLEGKSKEAISAFTSLLELYPDLNELYPILCDLYQIVGRTDIPKEWIMKAVRYDSSFNQTFMELSTELLSGKRFEESQKILSALVEVNPDNHEAWNALGVVLSSVGRVDEAENFIKKSLPIKGDYTATVENLQRTSEMKNGNVRGIIKGEFDGKDWGLYSGERQTANSLEGIRKDHTNRYGYIVNFIKQHEDGTKEIKVLDIFCGNGYGSYMLANEIGFVKIDAMDGSGEAINFAKQYFHSDKIRYQRCIFPSPIEIEQKYDYIVAIESIEHVEDDLSFLSFLLSRLKNNGVLFLSFPNKHKLDLAKNPNPYHFRHYDIRDIRSLLENGKDNMQIIESHGQDVYVVDENGIIRGLMQEKDMVLSKDYEGQFLMINFRKVA